MKFIVAKFICILLSTQHQQANNSMGTSDKEVTSDEDEDPQQQEPPLRRQLFNTGKNFDDELR